MDINFDVITITLKNIIHAKQAWSNQFLQTLSKLQPNLLKQLFKTKKFKRIRH